MHCAVQRLEASGGINVILLGVQEEESHGECGEDNSNDGHKDSREEASSHLLSNVVRGDLYGLLLGSSDGGTIGAGEGGKGGNHERFWDAGAGGSSGFKSEWLDSWLVIVVDGEGIGSEEGYGDDEEEGGEGLHG